MSAKISFIKVTGSTEHNKSKNEESREYKVVNIKITDDSSVDIPLIDEVSCDNHTLHQFWPWPELKPLTSGI